MPAPKYSCNWEITHECNYRCPYCPFIPAWTKNLEETNDRRKAVSTEDWARFWKRLASLYGRFHIELVGGEPFSYPGLVPLVQEVSRHHDVSIVTNLSWSETEVVGILDPKAVDFHASFHPHFSDLREFRRKADALRGAGYGFHAIHVAYPEIFEQALANHDEIRSAGIPSVVVPFQGVHAGREYPAAYAPEQREALRGRWFREPENSLEYALELASPKGRLCSSGQNYFRAYPDGWVFQCIKVREDPGAEPLGRITDPNFRLRDAPAPCPAERCGCMMEYCNLVDP